LSPAPADASETNAARLLLDEHRKVTDEIKIHLEEENQLFRYKFAFLGGLLLAFLVHIARGNSRDRPDERIAKLMNSSATCVVLALAFAIAVTIDLHIRTATIATNQLALWIRHYVEPAFLQAPLVGYEHYLRFGAHGTGRSMNSSFYYGFVYWPPLHFMTWVIYVVYLIVLQNVCLRRSRRRAQILSGFALVHFSLAAFAWMGHTAPPAFQFTVFDKEVNGLICPLLYLLPWVLLLLVNWGYVNLLFSSADTRNEFAQVSEAHPPQKRRGVSA
jgi:hypothetical protein